MPSRRSLTPALDPSGLPFCGCYPAAPFTAETRSGSRAAANVLGMREAARIPESFLTSAAERRRYGLPVAARHPKPPVVLASDSRHRAGHIRGNGQMWLHSRKALLRLNASAIHLSARRPCLSASASPAHAKLCLLRKGIPISRIACALRRTQLQNFSRPGGLRPPEPRFSAKVKIAGSAH